MEGSGKFIALHSSVLEYEPGIGRVRSLVFLELGLGSTRFLLNKFNVLAFWRGSNRFEVRFCWKNLGLSEFEV